jgi:transposase InsO family protein
VKQAAVGLGIHEVTLHSWLRQDDIDSGRRPGATTQESALAETVNGYYKAELVRGPEHPGPWKSVEELELATLGWVHWHNQERLHGFIGDVPPAEFEEAFYAEQRQEDVLAENTTLGSL